MCNFEMRQVDNVSVEMVWYLLLKDTRQKAVRKIKYFL